jgi:hypothetical protein
MGQAVTPREELAFVAFARNGDDFRASLPVEEFVHHIPDPERQLERAVVIYRDAIDHIQQVLNAINADRRGKRRTAARDVWRVGDCAFELQSRLAQVGLQIDDLYGHLERDLGAKRKWLEKAIIFRRYIPSMDMIPASLNWGKCEKGTRRAAERIGTGKPVG